MPVLNPKYNYTKVWRPKGTKYADGTDTGRFPSSRIAVQKAYENFKNEFGRMPVIEKTVIEVIGVTAKFDARVYEIEDEIEDRSWRNRI